MTAEYDADYYASHLGERYAWDNAAWHVQFGRIAEAIAGGLAARTALDAGCGIGFLVAFLRERGVDAEGLDVSEYAISQVPAHVAPHCRVASILDPLERRYDMIACIEVLEHLGPEDAEPALDNLTSHTDVILFSSTPDDFSEPTHRNVRPTSYWAELFARRSFFRDPRFDASIVTPHAGLFRRIPQPDPVELAVGYEQVLERRAAVPPQPRRRLLRRQR